MYFIGRVISYVYAYKHTYAILSVSQEHIFFYVYVFE